MIRLVILLALGFFAIGCSVGMNVTRGSGNVVTETRAVSDFHRVALAGVGEMNITQGDTESLTIEADDNLMPLITTKVENGTLTIGLETDRGRISINPSRPIKYTLSVKTLDGIDVSGAGNISAPSLKSDTLTYVGSGAGNLNIPQLETKQLRVTISGAGNASLGGTAETQELTMTGVGNYSAGDLKTTKTAVTVSGVGSATVWATQNLNVSISGAGSVSYYGSPQVTQQTSGIGSVKKLGDK